MSAAPESPESEVRKCRLIDQQKLQCLFKGYARGDKRSCRILQQMDSLAKYRRQNRYRPEMHQRAGLAIKNPAATDGVNVLSGDG